MLIYLIRHAHAIDGEEDDVRPLSPKGLKQIRRTAAFFRRNGLLAPAEWWHSPLVRARDTATLLRERLAASGRLVAVKGMRPDDDPAILAKRLRTVRRPVAVVGHEPHLGALASLLIAGQAEPPRFVIRKGAVMCLERTKTLWAACWQVTPELLP